MQGINVVTAEQLKKWDADAGITKDGVTYWTPARPIGLGGIFRRFRLAWMVFTGKADVLKWRDQ